MFSGSFVFCRKNVVGEGGGEPDVGDIPAGRRVGADSEIPGRRAEAGAGAVPRRRGARTFHRLHRRDRRHRHQTVKAQACKQHREANRFCGLSHCSYFSSLSRKHDQDAFSPGCRFLHSSNRESAVRICGVVGLSRDR